MARCVSTGRRFAELPPDDPAHLFLMDDPEPSRQGALRRLLGALAGPVRRNRGWIVIHSYRGYGTEQSVYLVGRVLRQPGGGSAAPRGRLLLDIVSLARRFLRWGVSNAEIEARMGEVVCRLRSDRAGWFEVCMRPGRLRRPEELWHPVELRLSRQPEVSTTAYVLIPPARARRVVISDIDDTVVHTGVANFFVMAWNLFMRGADSRVAFAGVRGLYQALHAGADQHECNPMLYVSRGPWSIYEVLEQFFQVNQIPVGPVLFLRDWGLSLQYPLPRKAVRHKHALIERMLSIFGNLPFVLIGDSGQRDPETYADLVEQYRNRIAAVYIRNVTSNDERRRAAIDALAGLVSGAGSSLLLASDSLAMAEHALERGLIAPEAVEQVRAEIEESGGAVRKGRHEAAPEAASEVLETDSEPRPPNVEVD